MPRRTSHEKSFEASNNPEGVQSPPPIKYWWHDIVPTERPVAPVIRLQGFLHPAGKTSSGSDQLQGRSCGAGVR